MTVKTHYDNLSVAKNAPSEVIRAAYKVLAQKYEADRNQNEDVSGLLHSLNNSYAVLSNPIQRAEYDQWLRGQESASNANKGEQSLDAEKSSSECADKKTPRTYRGLIYSAIGLAALTTIGWFGLSGDVTESKSNQTAVNKDTGVDNDIASQKTLTQSNSNRQIDSIPSHDNVAMNQFIGRWKGSSADSAIQQILEISLKTNHSLIFLLDAKAGRGIGGVYGIAEFQDGYARFFNSEYGCSIVFTMKSDILHTTTSDCQAYHAKGVSFDGDYTKPTATKVIQKPKPVESKVALSNTNQTRQPEIQAISAKNSTKLVKFIATVKDSAGNESTFELVAKDKKAAKKIIRDFRGNPKVVKISEVKN